MYQLVPLDLRDASGGRTKHVESLDTADANAAKTVGTAQRAVRLAQFEEKRRELNLQRIEKVTPELP
jgi:hypothetical protein